MITGTYNRVALTYLTIGYLLFLRILFFIFFKLKTHTLSQLITDDSLIGCCFQYIMFMYL